MKQTLTTAFAQGLMAALTVPAAAQEPDLSAFETGPVFAEFGRHVAVDTTNALPADTRFAVAFDVVDAAEGDARNRGFESAARFINMHVAAGVPEENIRVAVVVHGKAVFDLLAADGRESRNMPANGSATMLRTMMGQGVRIIICGQSAAANGVKADELIEGVEVELSAMTAHALLQQAGYTVNPF